MLINGIELSKLGVQLFDRVLYSNSIDTAQEWLDGDIQPTFIRQQDRFKTIELQFLVLSFQFLDYGLPLADFEYCRA